MAHSALSAFVALASLTLVAGQTTPAPAAPNASPTFPVTPLSNIPVTYSDLPYQVITSTYARGTQSGYNQCNSTTQNQNSECQTLIVNSIFDFCLYAPGKPNSTISDTEGEEVAWCTTKQHGTRGIPPGTFTGLQVLRNANYLQFVGFINQANVNIQPGDFGGELDGGGQDGLGNPIGAEVFSTAFSTDNSTYEHTSQWNVFIGGNQVGIKVCNPSGSNPAGYCQHTLDRIGLIYNMPNQAVNGTFEVCDSDAMDVPGVYTSGGQTLSYSQPAESLGPITSIPYTPRIPASSNCQTYQSSQIFTDFASLAPSTTAASPTGTGASKNSGTRAGSAASASATGSNGAGTVTISLFSTIVGVAFSFAFLA
ncbi:hypothetical protein BJV77DRAFT_1071137 [Russula vinacea]|nr:hypothetical protein BJV77DRAFT_1071137 [Russula vinacea]